MAINLPCPVCKAAVPRPAMGNASVLICPNCGHRFRTTRPVAVSAEPVIPVLEAVDAIPEVLPVSPVPTVEPAPPRRTSARPRDDVLWWEGHYTDGLSSQAGIIVLRPEMVVFLPTEKSKHVASLLGATLVKAALHIHTISLDWLQSRPDPLLMVRDLWAERSDDFDRCVIEAAEHLGGWAWPRNAVRVARPEKGSRSENVIFVQGRMELRGNAPRKAVLDHLLKEWQETDEPLLGTVIALFAISLLPLFMAAVSFIAHLFTNDIPWWAGLIWVGVTGLLYVAVGIKVALVWLRRKRKPTTESHENRTGSD